MYKLANQNCYEPQTTQPLQISLSTLQFYQPTSGKSPNACHPITTQSYHTNSRNLSPITKRPVQTITADWTKFAQNIERSQENFDKQSFASVIAAIFHLNKTIIEAKKQVHPQS